MTLKLYFNLIKYQINYNKAPAKAQVAANKNWRQTPVHPQG